MGLRTSDAGTIPGGTSLRGNLAAGLGLLLGIVFLGTGVAKLARTDFVLETFGGWDLPLWLLYAVALAEVVAGTLALVPATRARGAALVLALMVGACGYHLGRGEAERLLVPLAAAAVAIALLLLLAGRPRHPPPPRLT